jgi:hypothetical protein
MIIKKENFYSFIFALLLFAQLYVESFRINTVLQIGALMVYFFFEKPKVSAFLLKVIIPPTLIFIIGFFGFFFHKYHTFNFIKDVFHFLKPILGLSIGYLFFSKSNDFKSFIKVVVLTGFFSALVHFLVLFISGNIFSGSVEVIREYSKDNFLELFGIFFLIYFERFHGQRLFVKKLTYRIIFLTLLASCILYFSRTMVIVAFILFVSLKGYTYLTFRSVRILGLFVVMIIAVYAYLFSIKIDRNAEGLENFMYKIKNAPSELFVTRIDRDNHKDLWDHWRGYEVKCAFDLMNEQPTSYLIGTGQGSLVNLRFKAPLAGNESNGLKFISELHNGYIYIFYKTGAVGLVIVLVFLFSIYNVINKKKENSSISVIFISAIGLIFFFSTLTITGIYNSRDVIIYILGALLYFYNDERRTTKNSNEAN